MGHCRDCPKGKRMMPYAPRRMGAPIDRPQKRMREPDPPDDRTDFEMVRDEAGLGAQDRVTSILSDSQRPAYPRI